MAINNFNTSWENHTGEEVQEWINGNLEDLTNRAIVAFDTPEVDGSRVTIKGVTKSGTVVSTSFNTIAPSTYSTVFNQMDNTDYDQIVQSGTDITIPYSFGVADSSGRLQRGFKADIKYRITNGIKQVVGEVKSETSQAGMINRSFTIPGNMFTTGVNTLVISADTEVEGRTATVTWGVITITCLDLQLSISASKIALTTSETTTLTSAITNAGSTVPNGVSINYKLKYGNSVQTGISNLNGSYQLSQFNANAVNSARVPVYICAYVPETTINSNIVKLEFINLSHQAADDNAVVSLDVVDENPQDMNDVTKSYSSKVRVTQYDSYTFKYTVNAVNDAIPITIGNEVVDYISANGVKSVEYTYTFREAGETSITVLGNTTNITVVALDVNLQYPEGATYSVDNNNKNWDGDFDGIDNISTGFIGNSLVLTNNASFIANYTPFAENSDYTLSFKYKVENGVDESEELISCTNGRNNGFSIKPNSITINNGQILTQSVDNSEVHEVTLVCYGNNCGMYSNSQAIFIDGKIQAISTISARGAHYYKISCTANKATLYLESINCFDRALTFTEIQSLYIFNKGGNDIAPYIKRNNIFKGTTVDKWDYRTELDINKVPDGSLVLVLSAPEDSEGKTPWYIINSYEKNEENKKRKHLLSSMRFYQKQSDENATHPRNFYAVGGVISAQGTSSMAYPIKNYRIYFNKDNDIDKNLGGKVSALYLGRSQNFIPTQDSVPDLVDGDAQKGYQLFKSSYGDVVTKPSAKSNRFCLKADFAESSGTHNTGFARFSENILKNSDALINVGVTGLQEKSGIPPQQVENYNFDVRMNIDGRPIYLFFYNETTLQYEYGGRYNMNNDKSNVQVFGFEKIDDYYNNETVIQTGETLAADPRVLAIDPHFRETHNSNGDYINPTECWEFSSNDGDAKLIGGFCYKNARETFSEKSDDSDPDFPSSKALRWLNEVWEYRYPDFDSDSLANQYYRTGESKPYYLYTVYDFLYENNYSKFPAKLDNFASNLHYFFNVNSTVKYFVLTHWFACLDQRIKNCMLAFYADPYGVTSQEASTSPLNYVRAFWLFYDNDTLLGLNNAGEITVPWNFYETDSQNGFPGVGMHGLWNNLQKCYEVYKEGRDTTSSSYQLGALVERAYQVLRAKGTDALIKTYFEDNQCASYPDAIHNLDLEIKYLNPSTVSSKEDKNYAKAQGTRDLHRKLWLKKRTAWLDNIYGYNVASNELKYKSSDQGGSSTNGGTVSIVKADDYRFWKFYSKTEGGNAETPTITNSTPATLTVRSGATISGFVQIQGINGAKSIDFTNYNFGGMSNDAGVSGTFPYLTSLIIRKQDGTNIVTPANNPFQNWLVASSMPNLEELYICNVGATQNLNVSGFNRLRVLDTRGSNFGEVILPSGSLLTNLYLEAPTNINIINKPNLTVQLNDNSNLSVVTLNNTSKNVYMTLLSNIKQGATYTVVFGTSTDDRYTISKDELDLLASLPSTINVSGFVYYGETYENKDEIDRKFPNLNISDTLSGEPKLSFNGQLREDQIAATFVNGEVTNLESLDTLKISSTNAKIINWEFKIDSYNWNESNLNNKIAIVDKGNYACRLHADPTGDNSGTTHTLVVRGQLENGEWIESNSIVVSYIPITSITLKHENNGYTDGNAQVTIDIGDSTKGYLLNQEYSSNITAKINDVDQTIMYADNKFAYINASIINDSVLNVSVWGISATYELYKDGIIFDRNDRTTYGNELEWMNYICENRNYVTITKSDASKIELDDSYLQSLMNNINSDQTKQSNPIGAQDFTNLQYFKYPLGNIFNIPSVRFTNLSVPYNTTRVKWTNVSSQSAEYETITFGKNVNRVQVNLTFTTRPDRLVLDLSKTPITKILNNGDSTEDNVANVSITLQGSISKHTGNPLFIYPSSLIQLGNINTSTSTIDVTTGHNAIFNWIDSNNERIYTKDNGNGDGNYPIFNLGTLPESVKTLGVISSYKMIESPISNTTFNYVETIQGVFAYNNMNLASVTLGILKVIGEQSFYESKALNFSFGSGITEIKRNAFQNITVALDLDFSNVQTVGVSAFNMLNQPSTIKFGDALQSLPAGAFINNTTTITIIFNRRDRIDGLTVNSFTGSRNYILKAPANTEMLTQLQNLNLTNNITVETYENN